MGPATASSSKGLWGGFAKQLGAGGGGVSVQLFSMKGDHFSTCFLFPIMHYGDRIFFLLFNHSNVDETEDKRDMREIVMSPNEWVCEMGLSEHKCGSVKIQLIDWSDCGSQPGGRYPQRGRRMNLSDHKMINGIVKNQKHIKPTSHCFILGWLEKVKETLR